MQDPIFDHFKPFAGYAPTECSVGFIGDLIHDDIERWECDRSAVRVSQIPPVDEEYFEWIDVLKAVKAAGRTFTMIELGAAYGRWSVRAGLAAKALGKKVRLSLAEPEPQHLDWIQRHLALNGLAAHKVYAAAIDNEPGDWQFGIQPPGGDAHPDGWFGQGMMDGYKPNAYKDSGETYFGRPLMMAADGWGFIHVPRMTLSDILEDYRFVDLIDMDIQGSEARAVAEAIGPLTQKVRRLHIGTHAAPIEAALKETLTAAGWTLHHAYECHQVQDTPYGSVSFVDGVQSWTNPRLAKNNLVRDLLG